MTEKPKAGLTYVDIHKRNALTLTFLAADTDPDVLERMGDIVKWGAWWLYSLMKMRRKS